jgi:hypothetical protein
LPISHQLEQPSPDLPYAVEAELFAVLVRAAPPR